MRFEDRTGGTLAEVPADLIAAIPERRSLFRRRGEAPLTETAARRSARMGV